MPKKQSVTKQTPSITEEQLGDLRALLPHVFTEGKVDFEKLHAALGDFGDERPERYSFSWAGKRDAIRILQTPSRATLVPARKESVDFDKTQNIFIEGDNLEVLKLLYKPYFGQVKMIYIDPPYNTGNDFVYPDNFADPLDTYLKLTGQKDSEGNLLTSNAETSGRYHSAWLSMMYPRLFLARQLLRDDGVIFISIDYHEIHNLKLLMNEVFGEEAFKNIIIFKRGIKSVQAQFETIDSLTVGHEYVVFYAKSAETRFKHFTIELNESKSGGWNNHWRGTDRPTMRYGLFGIKPENGQWRWGKTRSLTAIENYKRLLKELNISEQDITQEQIDAWYIDYVEKKNDDIDLLRLSKNSKPEHYVPPSETKLGSDLWTDLSPRGSAEVKSLFGCNPFDNPKPINLLKRMIGYITESTTGDIILDFFAGSGSTAQSVLELNQEDGGNRRFICVQLPESIDESTPSGKCAKKLGLDTIAEISKERIRRVIQRLKKENEIDFEDLGFKVFKLRESNYKPWDSTEQKDPKVYAKQMEMLADPLVKGWKEEDVLYEVALKEGYGLNIVLEDLTGFGNLSGLHRVTDPDKEQGFYLCLADKVKLKDIKSINLKKDDLFICRDIALDDETAANLSLQCRLKTI